MGKVAMSFFLGLSLTACMAAIFPFRFYTLNAASYEGTLMGPSADKDLLLTMCKPGTEDQAPCLVMFTADFMRLKENYLKLQDQLDQAQRNCR